MKLSWCSLKMTQTSWLSYYRCLYPGLVCRLVLSSTHYFPSSSTRPSPACISKVWQQNWLWVRPVGSSRPKSSSNSSWLSSGCRCQRRLNMPCWSWWLSLRGSPPMSVYISAQSISAPWRRCRTRRSDRRSPLRKAAITGTPCSSDRLRVLLCRGLGGRSRQELLHRRLGRRS